MNSGDEQFFESEDDKESLEVRMCLYTVAMYHFVCDVSRHYKCSNLHLALLQTAESAL